MAEETTKKSPAEEKDSGGFGDILSGIGKGLVDGLAESVPIVGKMVQYGVNAAGIETPDYADKTAKRAKAKQELIASTNLNKEYEANASLRDKQRKADEMKADEFAARAIEKEDNNSYNNYEIDAVKKLQNELSGSGLIPDEISDYAKTNEFKTLVQSKYGMEKLMSFTQNKDMAAYGVMDRFLKKNGMSVVDGVDPQTGNELKYLSVNGLGKCIPITKESIDDLNQRIAKGASDELQTRMRYGSSKTYGDPIVTGLAEFIRKGADYTNGSWTKSKEVFEPLFMNSDFSDRFWFTANKALKEYRGNSPVDSKIKCLQMMIFRPTDKDGNPVGKSLLEQAGYRLDEKSFQEAQKTGNMSGIILKHEKSPGEWETLTFDDFARRAEEKDTIGRVMSDRLESMRGSAIRNNKKIFVEEINKIKEELGKGKKTKSGNEKEGEGEGDWNGNETISDVSAFHSIYGKENCEKLSEKQREGLNNAMSAFNDELVSVAKKYGAKTKRELPDEALEELEKYWDIKMDDLDLDSEEYYSPVNSMIRQRSIKSMQDENAMKEASVTQSERFNEEWDNSYHGEEDSGAAFRRNYRLVTERADRDRTRSRNDEKIREYQEELKRRGK